MTRESEKTWLLFEIVFSLLIHWLRVTFCTNPDSNQTFIFCVWRKRAHTDGELAPLTLQPWHHLPCLLPFPGSHCSTHWLEASGDDPSSDKHKRVLCGPWVCLQYSGSQQVRTVEGGVRRWEGFRGWRGDIVWRVYGATGGGFLGGGGGGGGGGLRLATRLQLFCQNGQKQPWHYDIVSSQKYTHTPRIMARWPRHLLRYDVQERENRITDLVTTYRGSVSAVFLMVVVC